MVFNPAANSIVATLVADEELVAANSGIWTAAVLSQIGLAPLAGLLVLTAGPGPAFGINAASFLCSAAILTRLRLPPSHTGPTTATTITTGDRRGWFADAVVGARLITGDRVLRALAFGQLLAALSTGATSALLVVPAAQHLRVEAGGYGLLLGAIGVGAAAGPLLLTRHISDPRRPAFVLGPFLLRGMIDPVLATVTALPVALVALASHGLGTSTGAVTFNSLLQARTPAAARGRVFAAFDLLWQLGRLGSLVLGGVTADTLGIQAVYHLGGALLLLAAAIGWYGLRTRPTRAPTQR